MVKCTIARGCRYGGALRRWSFISRRLERWRRSGSIVLTEAWWRGYRWMGRSFGWGDESPEHQNFSPETIAGGSVRMVLTVADPDAMFARAVTAGAKAVHKVSEMHGWRVGRVVDPFGHHWEIGREL